MPVPPIQTIWDCYWSRPGYRLTGVPDRHQPESLWVCIRSGKRRPVSDEECADCGHWEPDHPDVDELQPL
jgi:hypothetical protein